MASTSENCLYLDVFAPAGAKGRDLPVMVWIHGGSLLVGESDDYNPAALVRHGITVVTINYRIGALGFLADAALANTPGGPSGDYGLMDQQAALRWVQHSIRGFGGDPRDVTLFGESADGLSTLAQLVSPGARGLFQRAIVESGTYDLAQQSLASAESSGASFAANVGCDAYEFNDENAPDRYLPSSGFPYGAAHAFEFQYLFDLSNTPYPGTLSPSQQELARTMKGLWTNFATTGVPGVGWPEFTAADQQALSLIPPRPQVETDYAAEHHCSFWNASLVR